MVYTDEMFNTQGESVALADMNVGSSGAVGPYRAPWAGRLIGFIIIWAGEAVTSLAEFVRVELNCPRWAPNTIKGGLSMANIRTAPAFPVPPIEWAVDQPVDTDQDIKGQYIYADAATPITCNLRVFGRFSTNRVPMMPIPGY